MSRASSRILAAGTLPALVLAACGGADGTAHDPLRGARVIDLALAPVRRHSPARRDDEQSARGLLARLELPAELVEWRVEPGRGRILPPDDSGEPRRIVLRAREGGAEERDPERSPQPRKVLVVPGDFPAARIGSVRLWVQSFQRVSITAHLVCESGSLLGSTRVELPVSPDAQRVSLELPPPSRRTSCHALAIELRGAGEQIVYGPLELFERRSGELLPEAGETPALFELEGDARRAIGLLPERAIETRVLVPEGAELAFSYGFPRFGGPGEAASAVLRLALESEDGERFEAELGDPGEPPRWLHARLPLARFAGRACRIRFELGDAAPDAICALGEARVTTRVANAPTVLLVTSDTHRADHVGVARLGIDVRTPAIDALAGRGLWFEDCLASTNVTNPSHAALMTGVSPRDTGIVTNYAPLAAVAPTLAERFREAGFVTLAAVSAPHLGDRASGMGQGFDRMSVPRAARSAAQSIRALQEWLPDAQGLPLFVWLHLFDAHAPYEPPLADGFEQRESARNGGEDPKAAYRGEVAYLDGELARLFELPRFADAIVAFTADHGESLGEHGIHWEHEGLYPQTIQVPLVLAWPGAPAGERVVAPVTQLDLGRTLLDLAGLGDARFPGRGLHELERDVEPDAPRFALAAHGSEASITREGWHLVLQLAEAGEHERSSEKEQHAVELYDLRADRACARDVLDEELERGRALWHALVRWLAERRELGWSAEVARDAEVQEQLAALGYAADEGDGEQRELFDRSCRCAWCARMRGEAAR